MVGLGVGDKEVHEEEGEEGLDLGRGAGKGGAAVDEGRLDVEDTAAVGGVHELEEVPGVWAG